MLVTADCFITVNMFFNLPKFNCNIVGSFKLEILIFTILEILRNVWT